ncbi:MAG: response regulator transcription factor [Caulobacteraceae bacterium]
MRPDIELVLDFAQNIDQCPTLVELNNAAGPALERFGVEQFGIQVAVSATGAFVGEHLFGQVNPDWPGLYLRQNFVRQDASIRMLHATMKPYTWLEAQARFPSKGAEIVMAEARSVLGSDIGLVVPIHEIGGEVRTAVFCGQDLQISPESRPALHLLGSYLALRGRELGSAGPAQTIKITPRQRECLKWMCAGKTDEEIGFILGISAATAHNHIEAAKRAMGVHSRAQAAVQAYRLGLVN